MSAEGVDGFCKLLSSLEPIWALAFLLLGIHRVAHLHTSQSREFFAGIRGLSTNSSGGQSAKTFNART